MRLKAESAESLRPLRGNFFGLQPIGIRFRRLSRGGFGLAATAKKSSKSTKRNERAVHEPSRPWPVYSIQKWSIERLTKYERNARTHSKKQIGQLRKSLREFGWTMPILVREDGTVIAGHGRLEAALAEKVVEVPVIVATGWTEKQCRAYAIADNKLGLNSGWDEDIFGAELKELELIGMDFDVIGITDAELVDLGVRESDADPAGEEKDARPQLEGLNYSVVVRCKDEAHQGELLEQLEKQGLTCEALIS